MRCFRCSDDKQKCSFAHQAPDPDKYDRSLSVFLSHLEMSSDRDRDMSNKITLRHNRSISCGHYGGRIFFQYAIVEQLPRSIVVSSHNSPYTANFPLLVLMKNVAFEPSCSVLDYVDRFDN